jgi:hypothetical protein
VGQVQISILNAYGTAKWPVVVQYVTAPRIDSVTALPGPFTIDATHIAAAGGATIQLAGADFLADDVVTVGGAPATVVSVTDVLLTIIAPPGPVGPADIVVTDAAGQSTTVDGEIFYQ